VSNCFDKSNGGIIGWTQQPFLVHSGHVTEPT